MAAARRGLASSPGGTGRPAPNRMLFCASPAIALTVCVCAVAAASFCCLLVNRSVASSAAPRSRLVSTYSGTTSRSSPGNTTRLRTRNSRPAGSCVFADRSVPISSVIADYSQLGQRKVAGEERAELVVVHAERGTDRHVHVEVLVGAQAAAEEHSGLPVGHLAVGEQPLSVFLGVDRVVRLVAALRETRVLAHDHCLVLRVPVAFR